mgnify:CR=1 FL=1
MPIWFLYSSIFIVIRWADLVSGFFGTYSGMLSQSGSGDSSVLIGIFYTNLAFQDRTPSPLPSPVLFFSCRPEASARGRWHRSGQGLRRGILLGLRETAKSIAAGPELAFGSDKCRLSSNAFSCEPRGSQAPCTKRPCPKTHRRCALAVWKIAYQRGVLTGARRSYVLESEGLKSRSISKISKIRWIACWWFKGEGLRAGRKM